MPENEKTEAEAIVFAWPKSSREETRASISTYRGHRLADVRIYALGDDDEARPTRKGISIRVADLPQLLAAVDALIAAAGVDGRAL